MVASPTKVGDKKSNKFKEGALQISTISYSPNPQLPKWVAYSILSKNDCLKQNKTRKLKNTHWIWFLVNVDENLIFLGDI